MPVDFFRQTVIRWNDPNPKYVPLLREGGITAVLTSPNESFEKACVAARIQVIHETEVQFVGLGDTAEARSGRAVVFRAGIWPGVHTPDRAVASATSGVWIDQNCYLVQCLRALYPNMPPVLGYLPNKEAGVPPERAVPFHTLELGLAEAWMSGGNFVMALEAWFRAALLKGAAEALAAWRKIGRTAGWLRENAAVFGQPIQSNITVLVENKDDSLEIANLAYRQNVSPALLAAANPPTPDPARCLELVAVGIEPPAADVRRRILANAEAGTTLVVDAPGDQAWWRAAGLTYLREDPDRKYYSLGKGQVVAYKEPVLDPSDLALDMIDYVTQSRRAARVFNCNAAVVMAGAAVLYIINYGRPRDLPVLARIQGSFTKAMLLRPEAPPQAVKVSRRGTSSEVTLPQLECAAAVIFG
ncbi:MAG: hypothetical protein ACLPX8_12505 [Bryobacteraceae bacterium]